MFTIFTIINEFVMIIYYYFVILYIKYKGLNFSNIKM